VLVDDGVRSDSCLCLPACPSPRPRQNPNFWVPVQLYSLPSIRLAREVISSAPAPHVYVQPNFAYGRAHPDHGDKNSRTHPGGIPSESGKQPAGRSPLVQVHDGGLTVLTGTAAELGRPMIALPGAGRRSLGAARPCDLGEAFSCNIQIDRGCRRSQRQTEGLSDQSHRPVSFPAWAAGLS